jgi:hypothetical protein
MLVGACDPAIVPGDAGACTEGATRACGTAVGECETGVERCRDGSWTGVCEGEVGPTAETCNLQDDDCDGFIDGAAADASCPPEPFTAAVACAGFLTCGIVECVPDHGNCSGDPGCETDLTASRDHCGACGMACDADRRCERSLCVLLPETNWLWSAGGSDGEGASDIISNRSGGAYLAGAYGGAGEIGTTMFTPRFEGGFVAEVGVDGRELWVLETSRLDLAMSGSTTTDVWVHGGFYDTGRLGPRTLTSFPATSRHVVAARIESGGTVAWTWVTTNTGTFSVVDSALLADGTLVLAGVTTGSVDFASTRVTADEGSATLVAIDSTGAVAWVSTLVAPGYDMVESITALESGEVIAGIRLEAGGTMEGVDLMPASSGGNVLVRLADGVPAQSRPYDGRLNDLATGPGATYMVVQCAAGFWTWLGREPCSASRPDRLVALDAAWEVQYHVALPHVGYRITTIDGQVVGALTDGSQLRLIDVRDGGSIRTWERFFSGVAALRFDGSNLLLASGFTGTLAVEGRVLSSAGMTDAMAWSARVR